MAGCSNIVMKTGTVYSMILTVEKCSGIGESANQDWHASDWRMNPSHTSENESEALCIITINYLTGRQNLPVL